MPSGTEESPRILITRVGAPVRLEYGSLRLQVTSVKTAVILLILFELMQRKRIGSNIFYSHSYFFSLKLNSVALVRERNIPTERPPLVGELVPTFADRGCRVASATDSHGI
jgi:hypothetical protein